MLVAGPKIALTPARFRKSVIRRRDNATDSAPLSPAPVSGGTGHAGRVSGRMSNSVNNDLALRLPDLVKYYVRMRRCGNPADSRIIRAAADTRMRQQQIDDSLNADLTRRAPVAANGRQYNRESPSGRQARGECSEGSQAVLGPRRAHLLVGCKLAASGGGFRGRDCGLLFGSEGQRRFRIGAGEAEDDTGDVILSGRWKIPYGFERLIEKFCHCRRFLCLRRQEAASGSALESPRRRRGCWCRGRRWR